MLPGGTRKSMSPIRIEGYVSPADVRGGVAPPVSLAPPLPGAEEPPPVVWPQAEWQPPAPPAPVAAAPPPVPPPASEALNLATGRTIIDGELIELQREELQAVMQIVLQALERHQRERIGRLRAVYEVPEAAGSSTVEVVQEVPPTPPPVHGRRSRRSRTREVPPMPEVAGPAAS